AHLPRPAVRGGRPRVPPALWPLSDDAEGDDRDAAADSPEALEGPADELRQVGDHLRARGRPDPRAEPEPDPDPEPRPDRGQLGHEQPPQREADSAALRPADAGAHARPVREEGRERRPGRARRADRGRLLALAQEVDPPLPGARLVRRLALHRADADDER